MSSLPWTFIENERPSSQISFFGMRSPLPRFELPPRVDLMFLTPLGRATPAPFFGETSSFTYDTFISNSFPSQNRSEWGRSVGLPLRFLKVHLKFDL